VDVELSCRYPRTCVPETVSRPCGTGLAPNLYPALRAGLSSTVPSGLVPIFPWSVACPIRALQEQFERTNLDKTVFQTK
jgi:hypothetical protein